MYRSEGRRERTVEKSCLLHLNLHPVSNGEPVTKSVKTDSAKLRGAQ